MLGELIDTAADLLSVQYVGKSAVRTLFATLQKRRIDNARDILLRELRSGDVLQSTVASQDDQIAILYRYLRSAHEGAARTNLRVMAKMIRGKTAQKPIYADDFLRYASLIEDLCAEEIIILATTYKLMKDRTNSGNELHIARKELEEKGLLSGNRFYLYSQALQRTGFVTFSALSVGQISNATELLREFGELAELEAIDMAEVSTEK